MNQLPFSLLETTVLVVERLLSDLLVIRIKEIEKSESFSVLDIDAPISITIGSSPFRHDVKTVSSKNALSLYLFNEDCRSLASSKTR